MAAQDQYKTRFEDPDYLLDQQYKSPANLEARISLHEKFSTNPEGLHRWLMGITLPRLPKKLDLLELGCGQGQLWSANADRIPSGWNLTLTDFSQGMLAAAKNNLTGKFDSPSHFEIVDAQAIPYPDATFDVVFAHFMLYHIPNRPKAYGHIRRVLRPGGWFFTAALGWDHLKEIYEMAMQLEETPADVWQLSFRLDNGAAELAQYFDEVELIEYPDSLRVTEAEPLIDYILSMMHSHPVKAGRLNQVRLKIQEKLAHNGVIEIAKQSGVFVCRRPAAK